MDFADIKPSIMNMIILFLMIVVVVNLGKFIFTRVDIPGVSQLVKNI